MNELTGKTICAVFLSNDKEAIVFELSDGTRESFECYGDCCSSTWIEHVSGLDALIGQVVVETESLDIGEDKDDHRDECVQVYETRLKTAHGVFSVEFRNGSNGYYGGSLDHAGGKQFADVRLVEEDF